MKPTREVVACVIDNGLFPHVAQGLSRGVAKTYYWTPNETAFPKIEHGIVGDGLGDIEKVADFWKIKNEVDLFVFPDIGMGGLQDELESQGKAVWGHHGADELETNRGLFLDTLRRLEMDVPEYVTIRGLTNLIEYLAGQDDKYVKVSRWRGDIETFHWRDWEHDEYLLDFYAYKLGPAKEIITFYVLDPIDADVEDGIDTYCIDGRYPDVVLHGMELKDRAYLGAIQKMGDISEKVRGINEIFGPVLGRYGYRGAFSTEVRISEERSYFIDPTCRFPSPPSQTMVEIFSNFPDIIWNGANGILIDPVPLAKFGVQILATVERDSHEWQVLDVVEPLRQWFKPCFGCEIGGRICLAPSPIPTFAGWLVAIGDTIEETISTIKERCELLPDDMHCDVACLAELLNVAQDAEDEGVELTKDDLPDPTTVLENNDG
jgi:hypothetical protein